MNFIRRYIGDLWISNRWYLIMTGCILLAFSAYFIRPLFEPLRAFIGFVLLATLVDYVLLFFISGRSRSSYEIKRHRKILEATREMDPRFSIGEQNEVTIHIENHSWFALSGNIIDELPFQFQNRDFRLKFAVAPRSSDKVIYSLRPVVRGEFEFGKLIVYASTPLGLLSRRFTCAESDTVRVYPAYKQMSRYSLQFLASNDNIMPGQKKLRRLGHSLEFEKIKEYVYGDDVRTINWKATARSNNLMVNTFADARQQQIYCLIDKGRNMKMPFDGMTLLDYSINACLALLNVALLKQDKAGLITFSNVIGDVIAAERKNNQLHRIIETLYKQTTQFKESDYEAVWSLIHKRISQRSLILFFTNFETFSSLERQLPFLRRIAQHHLVCTVFFKNTLLEEIHQSAPDDIEGIYIKTIADQFSYEKRQIVKELRRHGIVSILTTPQNLSIDVINKYLEMKARRMV